MTIENTDVTSFEYRGFKVHIIYCRHCCGQKPETKLLWQWCITGGGHGESKEGVEEGARKWIDSKIGLNKDEHQV